MPFVAELVAERGLRVFLSLGSPESVFFFNFWSRFSSQEKTPWVDSACADCPGFLVLGAAPAPASTFVSEPQIVPLC